IFFKDKENNAITGPFTVKEILEKSWENKTLFDYSTPFYVMTDGIQPDEGTPFTTFAELIDRRGNPVNSFSDCAMEIDGQVYLSLLPLEMGILMLNLKSLTDFAKVYLGICKICQAGKAEMIEWLINHFSELDTEFIKLPVDQKKVVFDELVRELIVNTYLYCFFCDRFMFTYRQKLNHMASPNHSFK
ncbi:hypothetical protein PMAYCL1PPCAC_00548, partial [Pristionchus mayeri]